MLDRILSYTLNFTIVTAISALAAASLLAGYGGLATVLNGQPAAGAIQCGAGIALAIAAITSARYRNELADRY